MSDIWTVRRVLTWTAQHFEKREIDAPRLTAEVLLAHALATTRVRLTLCGYWLWVPPVSSPCSWLRGLPPHSGGCSGNMRSTARLLLAITALLVAPIWLSIPAPVLYSWRKKRT